VKIHIEIHSRLLLVYGLNEYTLSTVIYYEDLGHMDPSQVVIYSWVPKIVSPKSCLAFNRHKLRGSHNYLCLLNNKLFRYKPIASEQ
jgi:hypothetical protein